eukprot:3103353-Lingulodinium_polyedra.AAC.1
MAGRPQPAHANCSRPGPPRAAGRKAGRGGHCMSGTAAPSGTPHRGAGLRNRGANRVCHRCQDHLP